MNIMKTRREFLCDLGLLSFIILFSDPLVNKWMSTEHDLGRLKFDRKIDKDEQIRVCYLGVGRIGMEIGEKLSRHVEAGIHFVKLSGHDVRQLPFNDGLQRQMPDMYLENQDIIVLVGNVKDPPFLELRRHVIPRAPYIWTIGIVPENDNTNTCALHHVSNEILRIARGSSFPYRDMESFMQSIFAVYLVQHRYIHLEDYYNICQEAFDDFGF